MHMQQCGSDAGHGAIANGQTMVEVQRRYRLGIDWYRTTKTSNTVHDGGFVLLLNREVTVHLRKRCAEAGRRGMAVRGRHGTGLAPQSVLLPCSELVCEVRPEF